MHAYLNDLLVLVGPSATGKSTVARALADRGLVTVLPTWTTRPRRRDEPGDTLEHRFVDDARFDRLSARRAFLLEGGHPACPTGTDCPGRRRCAVSRPSSPGPTTCRRWPRPPGWPRWSTRSARRFRGGGPAGRRGTDPAERELRLAGFHAERVAGARSATGVPQPRPDHRLVGAVGRALAADFETGGNHDRQPSHTTAVA